METLEGGETSTAELLCLAQGLGTRIEGLVMLFLFLHSILLRVNKKQNNKRKQRDLPFKEIKINKFPKRRGNKEGYRNRRIDRKEGFR